VILLCLVHSNLPKFTLLYVVLCSLRCTLLYYYVDVRSRVPVHAMYNNMEM